MTTQLEEAFDVKRSDDDHSEKGTPLDSGHVARIPYTSEGDEGQVHYETNAADQPWRIRLPALLCLFFLTLGSNYADATLGPLKSTIRKQVPNVSNARYGTIAASSSLVNAVLPIISGVAIDYFGATPGSIISSCFILVGTLIRAVGGRSASFRTILAGEIIFGLGSTTIETCQSKLYTHWSKTTVKGGSIGLLAFVFGMDIAWGRVFSLMGNLSAVPIGESSGVWYFSWWLSVILCGLTLALNVVYVLIERRAPLSARPITGRMGAQSGGLLASLRQMHASLWCLPAAFWVIVCTQLLQSGAVSAYTSNLAEVIQNTRSTSAAKAGYISSVTKVIPIVVTPLVGLAFDLFGFRMHVVAFTASLWVLTFSLLAFTTVNAAAPVVLGSLALTSNALPFLASIPLLVNSQAYIGTAFGIWKAFNSAGSTVIDVSTGALQDRLPAGKGQYATMFYLIIALKSVDVLYGIGYHILDHRYFGRVLLLGERQRVEHEASGEHSKRSALCRPLRAFTITGLCLAVALIATGYALYIVYSI